MMVSAGTITNGGALLPRSPYAADLAIAAAQFSVKF